MFSLSLSFSLSLPPSLFLPLSLSLSPPFLPFPFFPLSLPLSLPQGVERQQVLVACADEENGRQFCEGGQRRGQSRQDKFEGLIPSFSCMYSVHVCARSILPMQPVFQKILEVTEPASAPSGALLFLWASQANATPVSPLHCAIHVHHHYITAQCHTVPLYNYCIITAQCHTVPLYTVHHCTMPHCIPYITAQCHTIPQYTMQHIIIYTTCTAMMSPCLYV